MQKKFFFHKYFNISGLPDLSFTASWGAAAPSWRNTARRGQQRLRVFDKRVLRRIFGPNREEMT
jgi:hypothetical protein